MAAFLRYSAILQKFAVSRDTFDESFVLRDENDPYIPASISGSARIKRLHKIYLGPKTSGFSAEAADELAEAIITAQTAMAPMPPKPGGAVPAPFHSSVHRNPHNLLKRMVPRKEAPTP
jgi:hypothetical protein